MKRPPKIVLRGRKPAGFWFHVSSRNGQILATSEMYTRKENAIKGIHALIRACVWVTGSKTPATVFEDRTK